MEYIRLNKGLADKSYKLIPATENIYDYIDHNQDYYSSIYRYNESQYQDWKAKGTIAGIADVNTNLLVWDFDDKDNVANAKSQTDTLITRLIDSGVTPNAIQISFSGSKGFAVVVEGKRKFSPDEFKAITAKMAKDLDAYDDSVSNPSRIFRVPATKHPKSGLYKRPLTMDQFKTLSVDEIKGLAAIPPDEAVSNVINSWVPTEIPSSVTYIPPKKDKVKQSGAIPEELDFSKKPKWLSETKYALQNGFFEGGERNEAMMILAATYRMQGFPKVVTHRMLKGVAELQSKRTNSESFSSDEIWGNVVSVVYGNHWNGGTYGPDHPLLLRTRERYNLKKEVIAEKPLVYSSDIASVFKNFAVNIDKNTIKFGIDKIDKNIRITTSMLIGLLAPPGVGKTATALNILNTVSRAGIDADFYSLDMGAPLVYQRLMQKHTGMKGDKLFELYKNEDKSVVEFEERIKTEYKNVRFCFKSGISVEGIREHLTERRENEGKVSKLLVVDYLECIQGPYSDSTANTSFIAQQLKDIANDFDICVLLLLQPQKSSGDPSSELLSYRSIKGSSAIEQACSIIFTMWRPGFNPKTKDKDNYLTIAVVKNRMGELGLFNFHWEGLTGEIRELEDHEEEELNDLLAAKAREKAEEL